MFQVWKAYSTPAANDAPPSRVSSRASRYMPVPASARVNRATTLWPSTGLPVAQMNGAESSAGTNKCSEKASVPA